MVKPQMVPSQAPEVFAEIEVTFNDGDEAAIHKSALHSVQLGPEGGVVAIRETTEDKTLTVYPMRRVKRLRLTPSRVTLAAGFAGAPH